VRRFGIEPCDFFSLVEKLHRAVQKDMHIDSLVNVGAIGRFVRDLKDSSLKGDGVVFGHSALLLKAQSLFDLSGVGFSPGRL
jgi:hypothetical protein